MPRSDASRIHTLVTDIDDTITTDGALTASAYKALDDAKQAGKRVIVTTGRPAGWCDHIARMWPVDAVIGENGAFYCWYDRPSRRLKTCHSMDARARLDNRRRIEAVAESVLAQVPGASVASDQFCRLYDLAIDYCEDVDALPPEAVSRIEHIMTSAGMTAKVSSIHVNGWFGEHDKLSMSRRLVQELYGLDLDTHRDQFIYAGDSPNDAPMFGYFPNSVGVANVRAFLDRMTTPPQYVTEGRSGDGFRELVRHWLG